MAPTSTNSLIIYTALATLARGLSVLNILLLAHALPPETFGYFGFLQASAAVIVTLSTLNLTAPLSVVLAQGVASRRPLENAILAIAFAGLFFLAGLAAAAGLTFAFPTLPLNIAEQALFILFSGVTALQLVSGAALVARGQKVRSAVTSLLAPAAMTVALLTSRHLLLLDALAIATLSATAGAATAIATLFAGGFILDARHILSSLIHFVRQRAKQLFKFSVFSFIANFSFQWALWFVQRQLLETAGPAESAVFAIGSQFYNMVVFLPGIFGPLLLRHLSTQNNGQFRIVDHAGYASSLIVATGLVLFVVVAPYILQTLPSKYQIDALPITLAVAAGGMMFAKFPFSVYFQAKVNGTPELISSIVSAIILLSGATISSIVASAGAALTLRLAAHFAQFAMIVGIFLIASRAERRQLI